MRYMNDFIHYKNLEEEFAYFRKYVHEDTDTKFHSHTLCCNNEIMSVRLLGWSHRGWLTLCNFVQKGLAKNRCIVKS